MSAGQPGREGPAAWHRLAGLNALAFALGFVTNTLEPAVLGDRTLDLAPEAKNTVVGLLTFAGIVAALLWQPLIGHFSDRSRARRGRRIPYILAGGALLVAAFYLVALAPGLPTLLGSVIVLQIAANTVQAPSQALLPDQVPKTQRGAAAGWKAALEILAFIAGRQVSSRLVAAGEVVGAVTAAAVVVVAAVAVIVITAGEPRRAAAPPSASRFDLRQVFTIDRSAHPGFAAWFANRALTWGGFIALNTFLLFFVIDVLEFAEPAAQRFVGDLSALMGGALILVAIPAGRLADRWGRRRLIIAAGLAAVAGTVLLITAPSTDTAILAGGILGLSVGVFQASSWALATQIVPGLEAARMLGLANIATAAGSGIARLGGGLLIDPVNRISGHPGAGYFVLYGLAAAAFLLGTTAALRLPPDDPTGVE